MTTEPNEWPWAISGSPGRSRLGEFGERIGQCRAVLDGAEVAAGARAEPVAELVDRPQVDAGGVECEAVPVVDAGVLAEAVQEDDDGAWLGGGPVPVVGTAPLVIDEWHALTAPGGVRHAQGFGSPCSHRVLAGRGPV